MQPPPVINQPAQAQPASVASKADALALSNLVNDTSSIKPLNSIAAGLCLGLIGAALLGPAMMCAAFGSIAAGIAIGGLAGNSSKSFVDSFLFAILLVVSLGVLTVGFSNSVKLQQQMMNSFGRP
jgi:hypothetical protein